MPRASRGDACAATRTFFGCFVPAFGSLAVAVVSNRFLTYSIEAMFVSPSKSRSMVTQKLLPCLLVPGTTWYCRPFTETSTSSRISARRVRGGANIRSDPHTTETSPRRFQPSPCGGGTSDEGRAHTSGGSGAGLRAFVCCLARRGLPCSAAMRSVARTVALCTSSAAAHSARALSIKVRSSSPREPG